MRSKRARENEGSEVEPGPVLDAPFTLHVSFAAEVVG